MSSGVYLALLLTNKTLGAAFYDEGQACVYYMPDVFEDEAYKQLRMLIEDVRPTKVIASCAQDTGFLNALRTICDFKGPNVMNHVESVDDGGDDEPEAAHLDVATGYELSQHNGRNLGGAEAGSNVPVYDGAAVAAKFNAGQEASGDIPGDDGGMIVSTTAQQPEEAEHPEEELFSVLHLLPATAFHDDDVNQRILKFLKRFDDGLSPMSAQFGRLLSSHNALRAFEALLCFLSSHQIEVADKVKSIHAFKFKASRDVKTPTIDPEEPMLYADGPHQAGSPLTTPEPPESSTARIPTAATSSSTNSIHDSPEATLFEPLVPAGVANLSQNQSWDGGQPATEPFRKGIATPEGWKKSRQLDALRFQATLCPNPSVSQVALLSVAFGIERGHVTRYCRNYYTKHRDAEPARYCDLCKMPNHDDHPFGEDHFKEAQKRFGLTPDQPTL